MPLVDDRDVCKSLHAVSSHEPILGAINLIMETYNRSHKEAVRSLERAADRDYIEYGVSVNSPWLTDSGRELARNGT